MATRENNTLLYVTRMVGEVPQSYPPQATTGQSYHTILISETQTRHGVRCIYYKTISINNYHVSFILRLVLKGHYDQKVNVGEFHHSKGQT